MWAVAAAVSSQFRQLADKLADGAIQMLNHLSIVSQDIINTTTPLAQIQAWLLIAHYELLCKSDRQAMLTAGRAIRLVQLARLHELDADEDPFTTPTAASSCPALDADTFVEIEEQRRTFWLAYSFDRFCLLRNNWHSSIPEELVRKSLAPTKETKRKKLTPAYRFAQDCPHPRASSKIASPYEQTFYPRPFPTAARAASYLPLQRPLSSRPCLATASCTSGCSWSSHHSIIIPTSATSGTSTHGYPSPWRSETASSHSRASLAT